MSNDNHTKITGQVVIKGTDTPTVNAPVVFTPRPALWRRRVCYVKMPVKGVSMMANGAGVTVPAARNTAREFLQPAFTAVDERRFESEVKRIDTTLADERKNREKFETRIEKSVNDLRGEMNARFDKMEKSVNARFEKVDSDIRDLRGEMFALRGEMFAGFDKLNGKMDSLFRWMIGVLVGSVLIPIALRYFAK